MVTRIKVDDRRVVPSLTSGWVGAASEKIDLLISAWLTSDYSQSVVFHGKIMSLPHAIAKLGHDPDQLMESMRHQLDTYLGRYYDSVEVDVTYEYLIKDAIGGPYAIKFILAASTNGVRVNLAQGLEIRDSKVSKIFDISNGA